MDKLLLCIFLEYYEAIGKGRRMIVCKSTESALDDQAGLDESNGPPLTPTLIQAVNRFDLGGV